MMKEALLRILVILSLISMMLMIVPMAGAVNIAACGIINDTGTYTLTGAVSNASTCYQINASNVDFNCAGNTVTYGTADATRQFGFGVSNITGSGSAVNNVTIRGCTVQDGTATVSGTDNFGIYFGAVENSTIFNSTIITNGSTGASGIYLNASRLNNITNTTVIAKATGVTNAVVLDSSSNTNGAIIGLNATTNGTGESYALQISASNVTFTNLMLHNPTQWIISSGISSNGITNATYLRSFGGINFYGAVNYNNSYNITSSKVYTIQGIAYVNSSNLSFLNASAYIALNDITLTAPIPFMDLDDDGVFEQCFAPICTILSYTSNVFTFAVSRFTTYQAQADPGAGSGASTTNNGGGSGSSGASGWDPRYASAQGISQANGYSGALPAMEEETTTTEPTTTPATKPSTTTTTTSKTDSMKDTTKGTSETVTGANDAGDDSAMADKKDTSGQTVTKSNTRVKTISLIVLLIVLIVAGFLFYKRKK